MSILDSIHEAEAKADQMRADAKLKARNMISEAQSEANAVSEQKINEAREAYQKKLSELEAQTDKETEAYLKSKRSENRELAQKAEAFIPQAADYIIGKVIG